MKTIQNIIAIFLIITITSGCEDNEYQAGLSEFEHHYYAAYLPNNNTKVTVNKNQAALVKFPVQFYSSFSRSYDAIALYEVSIANIASPAILGQDFNIVDRSGNSIQPQDGKYSLTFPKAEKTTDTIYVKLLNNPKTGIRSVDILMVDNIQPQYRVDMFSTASRRPLEIR